jgi:hypothetical protein
METRGQSYTIDKNNNSVKCVALTLIFIALEKMVLRSEVMPMNSESGSALDIGHIKRLKGRVRVRESKKIPPPVPPQEGEKR